MDNPSSSSTTDLREYIALLWHWAWMLALATILAAAGAYLASKQMAPIYQASTRLLINEAPANKSADYNAILTSERLARTYAQMITASPVLEGVIEGLALNTTAADLKKQITVTLVRDTQLVDVAVEHPDPKWAAAIANWLVAVFVEQTQDMQAQRYAASKQSLEAQLADLNEKIKATDATLVSLQGRPNASSDRDQLEAVLVQYRQTFAGLLQSYEQVRVAEAQSTSNLVQVEAAGAPITPIRPKVLQNTLLAAIVGLMLAVGGIFLLEALDDGLKNPELISRQLGLPILGMIAHVPQYKQQGPVTVAEPRSPISEAFRALRTNIQYAGVDRPIRTLLVTSPSAEDGKSTISINLGIVMAHGEKQVTLIDADLRRPMVHKLAKVASQPGLGDLFLNRPEGLNGHLQSSLAQGLKVLASGSLPPNPSELLGSQRMTSILEEICAESDLVILDCPPVVAVTDAAVLAPLVDGVVIVARPGKTKQDALRYAVEQLKMVNAPILGIVLNDIDLGSSRYNYYHYKRYYPTYKSYYTQHGKQKKAVRRK